MQWEGFTDDALERFLRLQRLSFEIQAAVASEIEPGATERDAAKALMKAYRAEGVVSFFHLPVALFGERTTLPEPWALLDFWPTSRVLRPGEPFILDASPIFDGYLVDTSRTFWSPPVPPSSAEIVADDASYRATILDAVRSGASFREIAAAVDASVTAAGYQNCHRLHPGEVLGHRVGEVRDLAAPDARGFAHRLIAWFSDTVTDSASSGRAPATWTANATSDHPPAPGLWAVEPHIAQGSAGVKWEEILVVTEEDAFWLDTPRR